MMATTKNMLLGKNGNKGVLLRSGIIVAIVTTVFVAITGYANGDIAAQIVAQKDSLMPMWSAALTVLIGNPSKVS